MRFGVDSAAKLRSTSRAAKAKCVSLFSVVHQRWRLLVSAALFLLVVVVLVLTTPFPAEGPDYVLVIDSGSTGTRIYAYTWQDRAGQLPAISAVPISRARHKVPRKAAGDKRAYERIETEPGLDKFANDAAGIQARALGPLLDWAAAVVPRHKQARTPVFLLATAGLRRLPLPLQATLIAHMADALTASPFWFEPGWARVISGTDEGVFGWIAVNYLTRRLSPGPDPAAAALADGSSAGYDTWNRPVSAAGVDLPGRAVPEPSLGAARRQQQGQQRRPPRLVRLGQQRGPGAAEDGSKTDGVARLRQPETVGALDLGGSSLEVSFVPPAERLEAARVNVTIVGVQYPLYTHVHHRYGLNDAFDRSVTMLLAVEVSHESSHESTTDSTAVEANASAAGTQPEDLRSSADRTSSQLGHDPNRPAGRANRERDGIRRRLQSTNVEVAQAAVGAARAGHARAPPSAGHADAASSAVAAQRAAARPIFRHLLGLDEWAGRAAEDSVVAGGAGTSGAEGAALLNAAAGRPALDRQNMVMFKAEGKTLDTDDPSHAAVAGSEGGGAAVQALGRLGELGSVAEALQQVPHPCLHAGFNRTYIRLAVNGVLATPTAVQLLGRPDWQACNQLARKVVTGSQPCPTNESCALGSPQPRTKATFYALTGFFVVFHFFGLGPASTLADLEAAGRRWCGTDWAVVNASRGAEIHVDHYCFRAPYLVHLLREGLGLAEDQLRMGTGKEAWTLGAALAEGSKARAALSGPKTALPSSAVAGAAAASALGRLGGSYALWRTAWLLAAASTGVWALLQLWALCRWAPGPPGPRHHRGASLATSPGTAQTAASPFAAFSPAKVNGHRAPGAVLQRALTGSSNPAPGPELRPPAFGSFSSNLNLLRAGHSQRKRLNSSPVELPELRLAGRNGSVQQQQQQQHLQLYPGQPPG